MDPIQKPEKVAEAVTIPPPTPETPETPEIPVVDMADPTPEQATEPQVEDKVEPPVPSPDMDAGTQLTPEQAAEEQIKKDEEARAAKLEEMKAQFKEMPLMTAVVSDRTDIRIFAYEELKTQIEGGSGDGVISKLADEKLVGMALDKAPNAQSIGFLVVKAFFDKAPKATAESLVGDIVQALVTKGFSGSEIKRKHASEAFVTILGKVSGEHVKELLAAQGFKSNPSFMEYSAITMRKTLLKFGKDSLPLDDIVPVLPSLLINARGPKVTKPTLKLIETVLKISETDYTPVLMKQAPTIPAGHLEKMKKLFDKYEKVTYKTEYWNQFEAAKVAPKLEKPKAWTEAIEGKLGDGYLNAAMDECFKILETAEVIGPTTREKMTLALAGLFTTPRSPTVITASSKLILKLADAIPVGEFDNVKKIAKLLFEQFKIRMKTADEVLAEAILKLISLKHIKAKDLDSDSTALKATIKNKYKSLKPPKTVQSLETKLDGMKKKKKVSTVGAEKSSKTSSSTTKSKSGKKKKYSESSESTGTSDKAKKSKSSKSSDEKSGTEKASKSKSGKKKSSADTDSKTPKTSKFESSSKTPKSSKSKPSIGEESSTKTPKTSKSESSSKTPKSSKSKSSIGGESSTKTPKSKSLKKLKKTKSKKTEE